MWLTQWRSIASLYLGVDWINFHSFHTTGREVNYLPFCVTSLWLNNNFIWLKIRQWSSAFSIELPLELRRGSIEMQPSIECPLGIDRDHLVVTISAKMTMSEFFELASKCNLYEIDVISRWPSVNAQSL